MNNTILSRSSSFQQELRTFLGIPAHVSDAEVRRLLADTEAKRESERFSTKRAAYEQGASHIQAYDYHGFN